jgi:phytoene synthase
MSRLSEQELHDYCRETIANGSQSFAKASRLFTRETRQSALLLYAWCRYCDDVIDGQKLGHNQQNIGIAEKKARLEKLYTHTEAALAGSPPDIPAFQALAYVVEKHALPHRYPPELLEGFVMDVEEREFHTFDDTLLYCYHVAGVVGVMMAWIMGVREEETLHRACDLGLAFQLTNIARDVIEDAENDRIYLPLSWLHEAGLPANPDTLLKEQYRQQLYTVTSQLLNEAEPYYASARIGIRQLPYRSAWAIATALEVYRDIGTKLDRGGMQAWQNRIHTSPTAKIWRSAQGSFKALLAIRLKGATTPARQGLWTRQEYVTG